MKCDNNSIHKDMRQIMLWSPVWKQAQVQELKDSRQAIRGDEYHVFVSSEEVWTGPVI